MGSGLFCYLGPPRGRPLFPGHNPALIRAGIGIPNAPGVHEVEKVGELRSAMREVRREAARKAGVSDGPTSNDAQEALLALIVHTNAGDAPCGTERVPRLLATGAVQDASPLRPAPQRHHALVSPMLVTQHNALLAAPNPQLAHACYPLSLANLSRII